MYETFLMVEDTVKAATLIQARAMRELLESHQVQDAEVKNV